MSGLVEEESRAISSSLSASTMRRTRRDRPAAEAMIECCAMGGLSLTEQAQGERDRERLALQVRLRWQQVVSWERKSKKRRSARRRQSRFTMLLLIEAAFDRWNRDLNQSVGPRAFRPFVWKCPNACRWFVNNGGRVRTFTPPPHHVLAQVSLPVASALETR